MRKKESEDENEKQDKKVVILRHFGGPLGGPINAKVCLKYPAISPAR